VTKLIEYIALKMLIYTFPEWKRTVNAGYIYFFSIIMLNKYLIMLYKYLIIKELLMYLEERV